MANRLFLSKRVQNLENSDNNFDTFNSSNNQDQQGNGDNNGNNNDNSKDKKSNLKYVLIFIIVFVVVFAGIYIGFQIYNRSITAPPAETTVQTTTARTQDNLVENPIDFDALKEKNSDIYAWIKVDDTEVDYPVVQSPSDDSFYLKHDGETKKWSASGAIYTELVNNTDFNDPITLIYGHNGYGSSMFTTLHRFEDSEFFNSHQYFYIYTPDRKLTYQVISAFKYDDRHIMNSFNFADKAVLKEFQSYIQNPENSALKNVRTDLDVTIDENSKIVILSTCITNQKSNRFLICGVLTNDEKTY